VGKEGRKKGRDIDPTPRKAKEKSVRKISPVRGEKGEPTAREKK